MRIFRNYNDQYRPWFAWYPTRVGSQYFWLETIERIYCTHSGLWSQRKVGDHYAQIVDDWVYVLFFWILIVPALIVGGIILLLAQTQ